jgi:hypothetical protein
MGEGEALGIILSSCGVSRAQPNSRSNAELGKLILALDSVSLASRQENPISFYRRFSSGSFAPRALRTRAKDHFAPSRAAGPAQGPSKIVIKSWSPVSRSSRVIIAVNHVREI